MPSSSIVSDFHPSVTTNLSQAEVRVTLIWTLIWRVRPSFWLQLLDHSLFRFCTSSFPMPIRHFFNIFACKLGTTSWWEAENLHACSGVVCIKDHKCESINWEDATVCFSGSSPWCNFDILVMIITQTRPRKYCMSMVAIATAGFHARVPVSSQHGFTSTMAPVH